MADALAAVAKKTGTTLIFSLCEWGWVSLISSFVWYLTYPMTFLESSLAVSIDVALTITVSHERIGGVPRFLTVGEFVTSHLTSDDKLTGDLLRSTMTLRLNGAHFLLSSTRQLLLRGTFIFLTFNTAHRSLLKLLTTMDTMISTW